MSFMKIEPKGGYHRKSSLSSCSMALHKAGNGTQLNLSIPEVVLKKTAFKDGDRITIMFGVGGDIGKVRVLRSVDGYRLRAKPGSMTVIKTTLIPPYMRKLLLQTTEPTAHSVIDQNTLEVDAPQHWTGPQPGYLTFDTTLDAV